MNKLILVFGSIWVLNGSIASAQGNCRILTDVESKEVISYASIFFKETKKGMFSDESGKFCVLENVNNIIITAIGYEKLELLLNNTSISDTIYLKRKVIELDEFVVIPNRQKAKRKTISAYSKFKVTNVLRPNSSFPVAQFFSYCNSCNGYIGSFKMLLMPKKSSTFLSYKVRIRLMDSYGGLPKNDLLNENVLFDLNAQAKEAEVDLLKYGVRFPKEGLWIAVQTVGYVDSSGKYNIIKDREFGKFVLQKGRRRLLDSFSPGFKYINKSIDMSAEGNWTDYWSKMQFEPRLNFCFEISVIR